MYVEKNFSTLGYVTFSYTSSISAICGCLEELTSKSAIFHTNIPATYMKACTQYEDVCLPYRHC